MQYPISHESMDSWYQINTITTWCADIYYISYSSIIHLLCSMYYCKYYTCCVEDTTNYYTRWMDASDDEMMRWWDDIIPWSGVRITWDARMHSWVRSIVLLLTCVVVIYITLRSTLLYTTVQHKYYIMEWCVVVILMQQCIHGVQITWCQVHHM